MVSSPPVTMNGRKSAPSVGRAYLRTEDFQYRSGDVLLAGQFVVDGVIQFDHLSIDV